MHDEQDRFADELDRIVTGQPPERDNTLATFARQVQMHQGIAYLDPERRERIRRMLMDSAASSVPATPPTGGDGPLSQPALIDPAIHNPWIRRTSVRSQTPPGWSGHDLRAQTAISIVTAFAILITGFAWFMNGQDGGEPNTPATRYAAAPTEVAAMSQGSGTGDLIIPVTYGTATSPAGTGNLSVPPTAPAGSDVTGTGNLIVPLHGPTQTTAASPQPALDEWWTFIYPSECVPAPTAADEPGRDAGSWPERASLPLEIPSSADAEAVARTARLAEACRMAEEGEVLASNRFLAGQEAPDAEGTARGRAISAAYPETNPRAFARLTSEEPDWDQETTSGRFGAYSTVYIPDQAVQLADGRIGIPGSVVAWEGTNDFFPLGHPDHLRTYVGTLWVLTDTSGTWLIDEALPFCVGDCDAFWSQQPEPATPSPIGTPEATRIATPGTVIEEGDVALIPVDDRVWLACPSNGPFTLAARADGWNNAPAYELWPGPAEPPTIPCDVGWPPMPPGFEPAPLS